jgi:hypothetical protein
MQTVPEHNNTQGHCLACGFAVFNRRFPNCERCGTALPAHMVYSYAERARLFEQERVEGEAQWRERQKEGQQRDGGEHEVDATLTFAGRAGGGAGGGDDGTGGEGSGDCG